MSPFCLILHAFYDVKDIFVEKKSNDLKLLQLEQIAISLVKKKKVK